MELEKELDKNVDFIACEMVKKLILLFVFEKMEIPLTDESIGGIIATNPTWMTYMDFRESLFQLTESKYVFRASAGSETSFNLTQDGRSALSHFFHKIPASIREEITEFAKENRAKFKRSQEYTWDYFKNSDGTYTVVLRIKDHNAGDNLLEIRFKTPTRAGAKKATNRWKDKAAVVYESVTHTMIDEDESKEEK